MREAVRLRYRCVQQDYMEDAMTISRRALLGTAAGAAICAAGARLVSPALADAAAYPNRPVKWIVPYAAGGATDVLSRLVCQYLSEKLGQSFVVENKPGAGSTIGTQAVINSPADGYTLLLTSTANAINASFDRALPFDFAKSITPVAGIARIPLVLVINNDIPANNVAEFIAYAKAHPGKISVGSSGIGTSLHLSGELFKSMAGIEMVHVPYRGSAPGLTDLMSGQIQAMFDNVTSSFALAQAGKIRALGVTSRERSAVLPDVPPIGDTLAGYDTSSFYGVGVPHGTPQPIVDLLNREINAALDEPTIKQRIADLGAIALHGDAKQFGAMLAAETESWRKIVEGSGVHKEG